MKFFNYYKVSIEEALKYPHKHFYDRTGQMGEEYNNKFFISVYYDKNTLEFEDLLTKAGLTFSVSTFYNIAKAKENYIRPSERIFILNKDEYDLFCVLFEEGDNAGEILNIVYIGWLDRPKNIIYSGDTVKNEIL